ncbi:hypothetical protein ACFVDH_22065 [Streptomyces sp. NPDC057674]|uniref:hypothetical protein n=1 Tax=Streptomyces sp. NPDC057674 TaxID=3346203 RepID=UPI0036B4942F
MADFLSLGVLGLVLIGAGTVAAGLYCATVALARVLARGWRRIRAARPRRAPARVPVRATVTVLQLWLPCHKPRCGHLSTVHHLTATGQARCSGCGSVQPLP